MAAFPIEFHVEPDMPDLSLYIQAEEALNKLTKNHQDIISASINIEEIAQGRQTPHAFEATVTLNVRSNNIAASKKADDMEQALRGALDAASKQVRKQREKLRDSRGSADNLYIANHPEVVDDEDASL